MKAIVYSEFEGPLTLENVPDPQCRDHGAIIRVHATGLCRSDWHGWMGHDADIKLFPHVPGHELAGIIEEVGKEVRHFKIGDRVTVPFVCACGTCTQCASQNHQVCDNQTQPGFTHWGSFAEYVAIDHADTNLVKLPLEMSFSDAAILGCRFITSYRAVKDQGQIQPEQWIAIHGCGGVGLSAILIAKALNAQVIAIDIDNASLEQARNMGADHIVNARDIQQLPEAVKALSEGGVHVSIDALGSKETCLNSIANLRKRGKHIQVGLMAGSQAMPQIPMGQVISKELEIIGSHGMQAFKYPEMMELIKSSRIELHKLIGRKIALKEIITELPRMNEFRNQGVLVVE